ncbi:MAG: ECF transporter S component [Ethanoligenens sp.]|uniref:ECF transporter S component n=1 Tax=Ethanoligenens sp. TaxID=2099655 RepID=UPI0039EBE46A
MVNAQGAVRRLDKTRRTVMLSLFSAIIIVLAFTPLGSIPVGPIDATTIHIPVIVGAILLGPWDGLFLGGVMGIVSLVHNTVMPLPTSFVFSPFLPFGSWKSAVIAIVPRMLIGLVAALVFRLVSRWDKTKLGAGIAAGLAGSITNTVFVLGGIYWLFGDLYAAKMNLAVSTIGKVLMGVVVTNGVPEAIVAAIISTAVAKALFSASKRLH